MYKRKPVQVKEILPQLFTDIETQELTLEKLIKSWKKVVDSKTYKMTKPLGIKNGMLKIIVKNSAWLFDLKLKKDALLSNLKPYLGDEMIKDIKFQVGNV